MEDREIVISMDSWQETQMDAAVEVVWWWWWSSLRTVGWRRIFLAVGDA